MYARYAFLQFVIQRWVRIVSICVTCISLLHIALVLMFRSYRNEQYCITDNTAATLYDFALCFIMHTTRKILTNKKCKLLSHVLATIDGVYIGEYIYCPLTVITKNSYSIISNFRTTQHSLLNLLPLVFTW